MIDLYLSDKYYAHWPAIRELALSDEPEAFDKLKKYALEGYGTPHVPEYFVWGGRYVLINLQ